MEGKINIFKLSDILPHKEITNLLLEDETVRIEQIISTGQVSPDGFWYDQSEQEWVLLLQGTARLEFVDGKIRQLNAGEHLLIPAHVRHRIVYTSIQPPCIWLCVFYER